MTSDKPQDSRTAFDEAVRSAHAASLDNLSPRVRAQLAQRRRAALADNARPHIARRWPMLALGSAAALALAIGLFVLRGTDDAGNPPTPGEVAVDNGEVAPLPAPTTTTTPVPETTAPPLATTDAPEPSVESIIADEELPAELLAAEFAATDAAMGFDALEESPDFYLWLGSEEAQADITESL